MAAIMDELKIRDQYFEMIPANKIKWKVSWSDLTVKDQQDLLNLSIFSKISQSYPPSYNYRSSYLKYIIRQLECCNNDICEEIYKAYSDLITTAENDSVFYKTYFLYNRDGTSKDGCDLCVTLQETNQLGVDGTTGMRTWEAGKYLGAWFMEQKTKLHNKNVLELGCGSGFSGIVALKSCFPSSYIFTDFHNKVLLQLRKNIEINFKKDDYTDWKYTNKTKDDDIIQEEVICAGKPAIHLAQLDWSDINLENLQKRMGNIDIIVGADVTYSSSHQELVKVINALIINPYSIQDGCEVYIASTLRNLDTYQNFLATLSEFSLTWTKCEHLQSRNVTYDQETPIEIIQITKV